MSAAAFHDWESAAAVKLLLPQRDEQFKRSAAAINNRIVSPTGRPWLALSPQPSPSPNNNPKSAGRRLLSFKDHA